MTLFHDGPSGKAEKIFIAAVDQAIDAGCSYEEMLNAATLNAVVGAYKSDMPKEAFLAKVNDCWDGVVEAESKKEPTDA